MNRSVWIGVAVMSALILTAAVWVSRAQDKPVILSPMDREILLRTNAQLQLLQSNYNKEAEPIAREQQDVVTRNCFKAKIIVSECLIDPKTGIVSKRPTDNAKANPTSPAGSAPTAKK